MNDDPEVAIRDYIKLQNTIIKMNLPIKISECKISPTQESKTKNPTN